VPTSGSTTYGPFTLRWEEEGDGPPLLLLHGIYAGAGRHEWSSLVPLVADRFRVRSADLLGFGDSDRPELAYEPPVLVGAVAALIRDAAGATGEAPVVLASSLTAAYAVRAVSEHDLNVRELILITPTGFGRSQTRPPNSFGRAASAVLRRTPLGDILHQALVSRPSIDWFLRNQAYEDPAKVDGAVVRAHQRAGRRRNAKYGTVPFITGQLALHLTTEEVMSLHPTVVWAHGQHFSGGADRVPWQGCAEVIDVDSGLPQAEEPETLVKLLDARVTTS
jgi:pimeloyl-ACP methyl ester carboxylesterase